MSQSRSHKLAHHAATMRVAPTTTEALLWQQLRGSRLGVAFRRQAVLGGRFIVDFVAPSVRLVVEVDSAYHTERSRADARRDRALQDLGYRVLRVSAEDVLQHMPQVLAAIRAALAK